MQIVIELSELDYKWITLRKGDETLYPLTLTVYDAIKNGTPVKSGHWIKETEHVDQCSECGQMVLNTSNNNYCPNCGCGMVEPQESEDKKC